MNQTSKLKLYDLVLISVLAAILFVQQQVLSFIPHIQLTVFLLVLFSKKIGFIRTSLIVVIHVLIDGLFTSSLGIVYTPAILIGWMIIPITLITIFKHVNSSILLALLGVLYATVYCWLFVIPMVYFFEIDFYTYIIADIPYQISMALSSFITILILYEPCAKVFDLYVRKL